MSDPPVERTLSGMTDWDLLQRYAQGGEAKAFEELMRRHLDMVYGSARRRIPHAAEDVTQAVFMLLVQKARAIRRNGVLAGWLHRAVRYCCANVQKMENRRQHYEREAAMIMPEKDQHWEHLLPILDGALEALSQAERDAVLIHHLEGKSIAETGQELGISATAAAKRAARGLERLRGYFTRQGYAVGSTAVASLMAAEAAKAAPPAAAQLAVAAVSAAAPSTSAFSIMKGAQAMMMWARLKAMAGVAAACAVMLIGVVVIVIQTAGQRPARAAAPAAPTTVEAPAAAGPADPANWRSTFNQGYALAPGQSLKYIPPGRFPERQRYFAEVEQNDAPMPCIQWRWADGVLKRQWMHGGGPDGAPLSTILSFCANLDAQQASTAGLPPINGNGDWIVRDGASTDAILADLRTILLEQFKIDIRVEKSEATRDTLVVSGRYRFQRLPEATDQQLQVFSDVMDHPLPGARIRGGGNTSPSDFWKLLGQILAMPIADEATDEPAKIAWLLSDSIDNASTDPARRQQILNNISRQTGLTIKQEKRTLITWKLTCPTADASTPRPTTVPGAR